MKRKNIIISICCILLLLAGVVGVYYLNNKTTIKEKAYSFDQYNKLENNVNLLGNQESTDDEFMDEIKNGTYTIEEPFLVVNPYKISPLTAIVGFKTDKKVSVKVTIKAKGNGKDLTYTTKEDTVHYIPVYGLYYEYETTILLEASDSSTGTLSIATERTLALESVDLSDVEIITSQLPDDDFYFISTPLGVTASAVDQSGEFRWFLTEGISKQVTRLENGHFLLASPEKIETGSLGLIEVDLLGKIYNSYDLSNPYAYNYVQLPNGNILYSTVKDEVIELNLSNGKIINIFNPYKILSEIDSEHMTKIKDNFTYINAVDYDKKTDSIIIGMYHYSTVISLDKKGNLKWMLADPSYFSSKFTKYLLKPTASNFVYPLGNYNARVNNNNLTLMDNGWDLTKTYSCDNLSTGVSKAKSYKIEPTKLTITEEWSYGDDFYSFAWGDFSKNGKNSTITFGREFREIHADPSTCRMDEEGDFESVVITHDGDKEVFKMIVGNSFNSVIKMPFIEGSEFSKTKINHYSADQDHDEFIAENYKEKFKDAVLFTIPSELIGNLLRVSYYDEEYKVVLMNEYGEAYKYTPKDNEINIKKGIGRALILIEKEGELYNTTFYIDI